MASTPDKGLIRLIRKRVPKLSSKEIFQSLRRLTIHFESPTIAVPNVAKTPKAGASGRREAAQKAVQTRRSQLQVALVDLVSAGLLQAPCILFRQYKGHRLEATPMGGAFGNTRMLMAINTFLMWCGRSSWE
jgi:hypothetical protein